MSSLTFAVPAPASPFDIICDYQNGFNCSNQTPTNGLAPSYNYFFAQGTYTFTVSGAWSIFNMSSPPTYKDYSGTIFLDTGGVSPITLGDGNFYSSPGALNTARTNNPGLFSTTLTFNQAGGDILFYTSNLGRDAEGTITVSVVPEPISSVLFVIGGTTLAARSWYRRKRKAS
jgi:hypothetical protein